MRKIKVIIKRPDEEYGHMTHISDSLENLQKTVGGYIECVTFSQFVILCNEEGKIRGLPFNMNIGTFDTLVGTIIVLGIDGEDFADCPIDFKTWKNIVRRWRGESV